MEVTVLSRNTDRWSLFSQCALWPCLSWRSPGLHRWGEGPFSKLPTQLCIRAQLCSTSGCPDSSTLVFSFCCFCVWGSLGNHWGRQGSRFWGSLAKGNGNPLQYSCLENPMDGGAWWAAVHGVARSRTQLSDLFSLFTFMHWRRKWQPPPVFLPGESQGQGAWGHTELDTTEAT